MMTLTTANSVSALEKVDPKMPFPFHHEIQPTTQNIQSILDQLQPHQFTTSHTQHTSQQQQQQQFHPSTFAFPPHHDNQLLHQPSFQYFPITPQPPEMYFYAKSTGMTPHYTNNPSHYGIQNV
jgi:hypothetical protein